MIRRIAMLAGLGAAVIATFLVSSAVNRPGAAAPHRFEPGEHLACPADHVLAVTEMTPLQSALDVSGPPRSPVDAVRDYATRAGREELMDHEFTEQERDTGTRAVLVGHARDHDRPLVLARVVQGAQGRWLVTTLDQCQRGS